MFVFGWFQDMGLWLNGALALVLALILGYLGVPLIVWSIAIIAALYLWGAGPVVWFLIVLPLILMNIVPIRRTLLTKPIMALMEKMKLMPVISETEQVAIDAGSTWVDAELFSGKPNFNSIRNEPYGQLSEEEKAFLAGPVENVCKMVSDWEIYQQHDLPPAVWDYLKKERFFGMIVPKEFGGLGFSARAQSEVVARLACHSTTLCVTVMVPNSLGPAELLAHYGTEAQKQKYLSRLAHGEEIPCFALTEPNAGSDAGAIASTAEVFKGDDGKIYFKVNWDKRYITLAAVSTLIGLAVKLKDPNNYLGKGTDPGISCLLVPSNTPGVVLGKRHNPMGTPFYNCPTQGKDVIVPLDQLIGGADGAGRGWQMLMECLAAGRSISLPSQAAGGAKGICRLVSAYAVVRRQFGVSIGAFEGIEEPLSRIVGFSYLMEAARVFTVGAVDSGLKPAVVSAIAKYNQTELARKVVNDAMDIMGGAAISRGPSNPIANSYIATPISITVEGANILTRCMIIFGQGALRCHPWAYKEVKALQNKDAVAFDVAFWSHIGHVVRNLCRSIVLSVTRGYLAGVPSGPAAKYYRKLAWVSASFAIMADIAMASLGGALKMKEKLTGRYADLLSWMYLASAVLRRYEAEGFRADHKDVVEWSMRYAFAQMQEAFNGIFANFNIPFVGWIFKGPVFAWSRFNGLGMLPSDQLGHKLAKEIQKPGVFRDSITEGVTISEYDPLYRYESTFLLCVQADSVLRKISKAVRKKALPKKRATLLVKEALAAGVITSEEAQLLERANKARDEAVQVDSFDLDEFSPMLLDNNAANRKHA